MKKKLFYLSYLFVIFIIFIFLFLSKYNVDFRLYTADSNLKFENEFEEKIAKNFSQLYKLFVISNFEKINKFSGAVFNAKNKQVLIINLKGNIFSKDEDEQDLIKHYNKLLNEKELLLEFQNNYLKQYNIKINELIKEMNHHMKVLCNILSEIYVNYSPSECKKIVESKTLSPEQKFLIFFKNFDNFDNLNLNIEIIELIKLEKLYSYYWNLKKTEIDIQNDKYFFENKFMNIDKLLEVKKLNDYTKINIITYILLLMLLSIAPFLISPLNEKFFKIFNK